MDGAHLVLSAEPLPAGRPEAVAMVTFEAGPAADRGWRVDVLLPRAGVDDPVSIVMITTFGLDEYATRR